MDERPHPEGIVGWRNVGLLGGAVHVIWAGDRVDIGSEREGKDEDVGELAVSGIDIGWVVGVNKNVVGN